MSATLDDNLSLLRRAHVGAARRASRAWELLAKLRHCSVTLPYTSTLKYLASAIYFDAAHAACEQYDCVEEFELAFAEELKEAYPERVTVGGLDYLVLRPFFAADGRFLSALHLGYLRGCDFKELAVLDVKVPNLLESRPSGLSDDEIVALVAYHQDAILRLVNGLRHLHTATHYLTTGLRAALQSEQSDRPRCVVEAAAHPLVAELVDVSALPFLPAPSSHFGTPADRINQLRSLDTSEAGLACLLAGT